MNARNWVAAAALGIIALGASAAWGQVNGAGQAREQGQGSTCAVPPATPMPWARLGMMAIDGYGYVEVVSVDYGSAAMRIGLERGDRVLEINGQPVRSTDDVRRLVQEAAMYRQGQVRIVIDNVRARMGEYGAERYIFRQTLLDGFGPPPYPQAVPIQGQQGSGVQPVVSGSIPQQQPMLMYTVSGG